MTGPPSPPQGPWPPNGAMRFSVRSDLTVRTKTGDVFSGVVRVSAPEYMVLVGDGGTCTVWTGSILSVHNHRPRPIS